MNFVCPLGRRWAGGSKACENALPTFSGGLSNSHRNLVSRPHFLKDQRNVTPETEYEPLSHHQPHRRLIGSYYGVGRAQDRTQKGWINALGDEEGGHSADTPALDSPCK